MKQIVERITEVTQNNNISGKKLGEMLELKKSPLTDWKNGQAKPSIEQALKICEIFAVSIEWLLTGKEAGELTPEEQQLIDLYRNCSRTGQEIILENASSMQLRFPAEQEPEGVSTSKPGRKDIKTGTDN